jgi:fructose-bisphosphate aldolase class II
MIPRLLPARTDGCKVRSVGKGLPNSGAYDKDTAACARGALWGGWVENGHSSENWGSTVNVHYRSLGFVNTRKMFATAIRGGFAVPAYNFNNMEQLQAIVLACLETQSPVIIQVSKGAREYADRTLLLYMGHGAVEMMKREAAERGVGEIPIALHLDHGDSYDLCVSCIESGFSSVMIDGSHLPYGENAALTRKVVDFAHRHDVTVEGELGVLAGVEDEVSAAVHTYTRPEEVEDFTSRTGVDSLAISIGTSHGAYKFKPGQEQAVRLDILHEIERRIPGFPIVLHGSSSIPQEAVNAINRFGGNLKNSAGIPEEQLREAARSAVCKINIDSDGRLVMTAKIREIFALKPEEFDPRKYLGPAREALLAMYRDKNLNVLGSAGRAPEIIRALDDPS